MLFLLFMCFIPRWQTYSLSIFAFRFQKASQQVVHPPAQHLCALVTHHPSSPSLPAPLQPLSRLVSSISAGCLSLRLMSLYLFLIYCKITQADRYYHFNAVKVSLSTNDGELYSPVVHYLLLKSGEITLRGVIKPPCESFRSISFTLHSECLLLCFIYASTSLSWLKKTQKTLILSKIICVILMIPVRSAVPSFVVHVLEDHQDFCCF